MNKLTKIHKDAVDGFTGAALDDDDPVMLVVRAHVKKITTDTETGAEDLTYTVDHIEAARPGDGHFDDLVDVLLRIRDRRAGQTSILAPVDEPVDDEQKAATP